MTNVVIIAANRLSDIYLLVYQHIQHYKSNNRIFLDNIVRFVYHIIDKIYWHHVAHALLMRAALHYRMRTNYIFI